MAQALELLQIPHEQAFACEANPTLQKMLARAFQISGTIHNSVFLPARQDEPPTDLHEAGMPCQSYAKQGKNEGLQCNNGKVGLAVVQWIQEKKPKCWMLENVAALTTVHKEDFKVLIGQLKRGGYCVRAKLINTKQFGIPQNRNRVYIVGIRHDVLKRRFVWPSGYAQALPVSTFYDRHPDGSVKRNSQHERLTQATFKDNLKLAYKYFESHGILADDRHITINIGGVPDRSPKQTPPHWVEDSVPCLTATRASSRAFYNTFLRRRLSMSEMARLQGCPNFKDVFRTISISQRGRLLGNAMTIPVVMHICRELLLCTDMAQRLFVKHHISDSDCTL